MATFSPSHLDRTCYSIVTQLSTWSSFVASQ